MTFLQAMGVVFCVILGVGIILGVVIGYEQARCRRIYNDIKINKIDDLCHQNKSIDRDLRDLIHRVNEIERNIMRMKGKI